MFSDRIANFMFSNFSDTYIKLRRKLDIIKTGKEYNDMLRLKDELEEEMTKLQEEQVQKSNIFAGLHRGK